MSNAGSSPVRSQNSNDSSMMRSPMERKESLRAVLSRAQTLQDVNTTTMKNLEEMIQEADSISLEATIDDKACCQDEIVMDSQVMTVSSRVLKTVSSSLSKDLSPYNHKDFAEKLLAYVNSLPDSTGTETDWSMLEAEVPRLFKKTPNYTNLSGYLEPLEKKVQAKRQPMRREALAPTKRPEAVVTVDAEEHSVEETVQKIRKLISAQYRRQGGPIDFFRLILDPEKYGKTVENMLHVSFLVRDGLVKMTVSEDGNLLIEPSTKEMRAHAKSLGKQENIQNVIGISAEQWSMLNQLNQITAPMINF